MRKLLVLLALCLLPLGASAQTQTVRTGQLTGEPEVFHFTVANKGDIGIAVAMPDEARSKRDVSAVIFKPGDIKHPLALLEATQAGWDATFVSDGTTYRIGPSATVPLTRGGYDMQVWSSNNDSAYAIRFDHGVGLGSEPAPQQFPDDTILAALGAVMLLALVALIYFRKKQR